MEHQGDEVHKEAPTAAPGSAIRVLVVDDEEAIRRVYKLSLTRAGFEVETAANGRQALRMLLTGTFHVTVVDLRMQEMDGLAFIQEAKKIWPWQGFVICSGFIDDHFAGLAREHKIETILTKPVTPDDLVCAVMRESRRPEASQGGAGVGLPVRLIGHQLNIMRHISSDVLHSQNLLNGLIRLGNSISGMMPFHVMGILVVEENAPLLLLQSPNAQPESAFTQLRSYILERYEALSGVSLEASSVRVERSGPASRMPDHRTLKSITSVPVLAGDRVEGLLTLGSFHPDAFDEANVALLYQAASSLSTLSTALREMRQMATRDPLTGLYNRRQLDEELDRAWRLSRRYGHTMALLMLDLDDFKPINDQWGHDAGDAVIRAFAATLKSATRSTDILARYGGDEFIILLPQAGSSEAAILADRILETIRMARIVAEEPDRTVSASIGITVYEPGMPITGHVELITRADQALYRAKSQGRGRYVFWSDNPLPADTAPDAPASRGKGRVLLLDDEEYILLVMRHILEKEGYTVICVRTITEALDALKTRTAPFDLLLCDLSLPDGDGTEVLRWSREIDSNTVNIVVSGNVTADNAIAALRHGAYDIVQKPVVPETLAALLNRAMQYRNLIRENARYRDYLEEMVRAKKSELSKALDDIRVAYEFTLETMVAMLDAREFETGQHSIRVRDLTRILAGRMGVEGEQLEEISRGALLHDIGKIGIPDNILLKPGKLTDDEWEVMRRHPEIGFRFLKNSPFLQTAAGVVLSHHERWDGQGYPHGLKGEAINLGARIFAVVDAYDAMRSSRVYKTSISVEEAAAEIRREAGKQFDPSVVTAFLDCLPEMERVGLWSRSFV